MGIPSKNKIPLLWKTKQALCGSRGAMVATVVPRGKNLYIESQFQRYVEVMDNFGPLLLKSIYFQNKMATT